MAIGAVFISLPVAFFGACYVSALHGLDAGQGMAVYSAIGALALMFFTFSQGLKPNRIS